MISLGTVEFFGLLWALMSFAALVGFFLCSAIVTSRDKSDLHKQGEKTAQANESARLLGDALKKCMRQREAALAQVNQLVNHFDSENVLPECYCDEVCGEINRAKDFLRQVEEQKRASREGELLEKTGQRTGLRIKPCAEVRVEINTKPAPPPCDGAKACPQARDVECGERVPGTEPWSMERSR